MINHFYFRLLVPVYSAATLYFTVVVILGCVNVQPSWVECLRKSTWCFKIEN